MSQSIRNAALRPIPVVTEETQSYWSGASEGELRLRRCNACGQLAKPLEPRCLNCMGADFSVERMSGLVILEGRASIHIPALPGMEPPITVVECAVQEDRRIRLIALDVDGTTDGLMPGDRLGIGFATEENGYSYAVVKPGTAR